MIDIETICAERGLRMTEQRRIIAKVLSAADDHPDMESLYRRAIDINSRISIATLYRTIRMFEDAGIVARHDFKDGRSRYETAGEDHHDHLIDIETGEIIEFHDKAIEKLQERIAEKLGYSLVDHRMELYARKRQDAPEIKSQICKKKG